MALLEIKNLAKTYASEGVETHALSGVSLSIETGDFVAIMGPSGSGKSTLLHIVGLLDDLSEGSYYLRGQNVTELGGERLAWVRNKEMGFIFQSFNLLAKSTVLENVVLPLYYSDIKDELWPGLAKKAIESVGLSHRMNYLTSKLSGGERQRVAIARALVNNPNIILADEPTGNLDSKSGQTVMEILQKLNEKEGHTIILITHETYTAETAKRIIKIHDGRIVGDEKVSNRRRAEDNFVK